MTVGGTIGGVGTDPVEISTLEFDVLWEHYYGDAQIPLVLRVPSPGRTDEERKRIVRGVWDALAGRGLGSPVDAHPGLTHLLSLLRKPDREIDGRLWLGDEPRLTGETQPGNEARLGNETQPGSEARLGNETQPGNEARLGNETQLSGETRLGNETQLSGETRLGSEARLSNETQVSGETRLGGEVRLLAAATGDEAVLAVLANGRLTLRPADSTGLPRFALSVLPRKQAGPGQSITLPTADFEAAAKAAGKQDELAAALRERGVRAGDARTLADMIDDIVNRGQYGSATRDRWGRRVRAGRVISFFDTEAGRYLQVRRESPDTEPWTTISPAAPRRLLQHLTDLHEEPH
ncbi:ESX secretion-associated protein EspG [Actinophytocola glycyrrhizae]|uniref:ESX secretion-associated protein EspG n=1 Tax=Actinophytocola glycyrrhizae TaxID=2044873 RepID=A0ABV9RVV2_9PSEU